MNTKATINIKNLFLLALILKVGSSFLGWHFSDPWILGFTLPILFMLAYVLIGIKSEKPGVSDEKFADSCYYLGFIFTITSIIFSLFDLPHIGDNINDIAIRFGAAMVSTVLGLAVRVYLVTFKMQLDDAIQAAESTLISSHQKFTEQLIITIEQMQVFQEKVDSTTKETIERVNVQLEQLSKNHAEKLTEFFIDLSEKNQNSLTEALNEVKKATARLSESVDGYSSGMDSNIESIKEKMTTFTNAVSDRLKTTTFPDDFFANKLSLPLDEFVSRASQMSNSITHVVHEVDASAQKLSSTLNKLNTDSEKTIKIINIIDKINNSQQLIQDYVQNQTMTLQMIASSISKLELVSDNDQNATQELNSTMMKLIDILSNNNLELMKTENQTTSMIELSTNDKSSI